MYKLISKCVIFLSLAISFLWSGQNAAAPSDTLPVYWMNEIVVTENRLPGVMSASMYQLSSREISSLDASQPAAALQFVPALHLSRITKNEATIKLRGFEQRQISIFLDGVPVSTPYDGSLDLSQIAGDNLQAIRISRGAASSLYGTNTLGGSINILTSSFSAPEKIRIRLEGSDHKRYFSALNYHNNFKNFSYSLNLSREKGADFKLSDNFKATATENGGRRDNSAFDKKSLGLKLHYQITDNHAVGFNYTFIDNSFNIPVDSRSVKPRYWRFPDWRKNVFSLNSKHVFGDYILLRSTIYYDGFYNLLKSYDDDTYTSRQQRWAWKSVYDDYSDGIIVYPSLKLFDFGSTNGLLAYKNDVHKEKFKDFAFEKYETSTWSAGVEQDVKLTEQDMAVLGADINYLKALRAEDIPLRDPILLFNAQFIFRHSFNNKLTAHISAAKKSRFPTIKELYSERLGRTVANPDLKEEHSWNSEIGLRQNFLQGYLQVSLFYNRLSNLIAAKELGNETQQMQNIGKAQFRGAEFDLKMRTGKFNFLANYTYMKAQDKSPGSQSRRLEYRPEHSVNFFGRWHFFNKMYLVLELNYSAGQYYQNPVSLKWEKLNDYALLNFKYNYHLFEFLNWYVRLRNLTDKDYMSEYGVPMPGREIISGLRFAL